jgi:GNAT superfamily N-acetyltransferase
MRTMPTLHGARVHIRPYQHSDLAGIVQLFDDITDLATLSPAVRERRAAWLAWAGANHDELARLDQPPYGDRALVLTESDTYIGSVGLVPCLDVYGQAGIGPDDGRSRAEMGLFWMVHPDYQGQGVGRGILERLQARYADFHMQMLVAEHDTLAFYRKCGFRRAGKTEAMWIYTEGEEGEG